MTESEYKEMLSRYYKGASSPAEKKLIEEWLDSPNPKAGIPFENEAERNRVRNSLRESIYRKAGIKTWKKERYFIPSTLRIAASILLVAMLGLVGYKYYEHSEIKKYAVSEAVSGREIRKVILSDGSIIWLKPGSSLIYPKNFRKRGERAVDLTGEALFEIEKDPSCPFIVHSGDLTTTVLGTSFNIKATGENIEVFVLTGKVSVTTVNDSKGVVLLPEEKALYIASSKELARESKPVAEPVKTEIIRGTEYDMKFNDTSMEEIIRRIEGKFDVVIKLEDPSLSECVVTADFTTQSLVKTLDIISKVLSIEYKIDNDKITLKAKDSK
jgi:ferric-dicitrate binding protein FerR (iron transport regulator)